MSRDQREQFGEFCHKGKNKPDGLITLYRCRKCKEDNFPNDFYSANNYRNIRELPYLVTFSKRSLPNLSSLSVM